MPSPNMGTKARVLTLNARVVAAMAVFAQVAHQQEEQREAGDFDQQLQAVGPAVAQQPPQQGGVQAGGRSTS